MIVDKRRHPKADAIVDASQLWSTGEAYFHWRDAADGGTSMPILSPSCQSLT